jgi:MFS family permease
MSYEHAPWKKKAATPASSRRASRRLLIANLVFFVSIHLGGDWAWRVPFLASIILVIVGLIIRAKVPESPVFEDVKEQAISSSRRSSRWSGRIGETFCAASLFVSPTVGYAVSITYMSYLAAPSWRPGPRPSARCASRLRSASSPPSAGAVTDKIGRRLYLWCAHWAFRSAC